ncbi:IS4 family transposase [Patescibacteria group bacterium]|nr:IS4 family transposase [Patescibacteria group bacterium]
MSYSNTIFNQLLQFVPRAKFNQFVVQHEADKYIKKMTSWNQFIILLYAQATGKDSLREIETGFNLHSQTWYHLGANTAARSSISDANNRRSYQIFEKLFYSLLQQCEEITPERNFSFDNPLYTFDASIISLCLTVFDWAKYSKLKGALKIHLLMNNRTAIPEVINITEGKVADLTAFKQINLESIEKGSILVFDRAYIDYLWWKKLNDRNIYFVSRVRKDQNIVVLGQHKTTLEPNILADEIVEFGDRKAKKKYPNKLRGVRYFDKKTKKEYSYLTNNFDLTGLQIASIYKERWQIELFFKWIKQNLKIKTFLGTSKNAVLTQIWVAMIYYLLLAYIKFQTKFKKSLLELTRMIRETLLFRRSIIDLLSLETKTLFRIKRQNSPQMCFW